MIEKDWRFSQNKDGHLCIFYKNKVNGNWDVYQVIKKPKYKNGVMQSKKRKNCSIM